MKINPLAQELNQVLQTNAPSFFECLSDTGKKLFFPKGIISQGAEAKKHAHLYDATLGVASLEGEPMTLTPFEKYFNHLPKKDVFPYAPTAGRNKLREIWKEQIYEKNPSLGNFSIGLPIVTNGITHSINICTEIFTNPNDFVLVPDLFWGNYRLSFDTLHQAQVKTFPTFNQDLSAMDIGGLESCIDENLKNTQKLILILNFPNNPTGYTPTLQEMKSICSILKQKAENGSKLIVLCDDAYFGLNFGDGHPESIFAFLAGLHPNIIPVKLDGGTKENYIWGFRCTFVTFALNCLQQEQVYEAIEKKIAGLIRARISNANHASQSILEKVLLDGSYKESFQRNFNIMKGRAVKTKEILQDPKLSKHFTSYPFNSGYFMCIRLHQLNAEKLRLHLLHQYGIGTISINENSLRVGYCSIDEKNLDDFFQKLFQSCEELQT